MTRKVAVQEKINLPPGASIHFVGIGGAGMSAIARLLLAWGYRVSGSDIRASEVTRRLEALGARISIGHSPENVGEADLVVVSRAIPAGNPEVLSASSRGIPILHRAEVLARILQGGFSIAVTGTHGKTTTAAMVTAVAIASGRDPTALIGGEVPAFGGNARVGSLETIIAEVDESDGSFLYVTPSVAVITSLEATDHLDTYGDLQTLQDAFRRFLSTVGPSGLVVGCADSPAVRELLGEIKARTVSYALHAPATYTAASVVLSGRSARFLAVREGRSLGEVILQVPGRHNVVNALAALATSLELGSSFHQAREGLASFSGVRRRFEIQECGEILVVDDYAHNPTKVKAALRTAREGWPGRRIIAVFQPHRYSRTRTTFAQFGPVFGDADEVIITEIYPADEPPLPGVSARLIVDAVQAYRPVRYCPSLAEATEEVLRLLRPGDLILTMGAGDVWKVAREVANRLLGIGSSSVVSPMNP